MHNAHEPTTYHIRLRTDPASQPLSSSCVEDPFNIPLKPRATTGPHVLVRDAYYNNGFYFLAGRDETQNTEGQLYRPVHCP